MTANKATRPRRLFTQWSMRGLLILVAIVAVFFAWLRVEIGKESRRRQLTQLVAGQSIRLGVDSSPQALSKISWNRRLAAWVMRQPPVAGATISLERGYQVPSAIEAVQLFPEATQIHIKCRKELEAELARALRGRCAGDGDVFSIYSWSGDVNALAHICAENNLAITDLTCAEEKWTREGCEAAAKLRKLDAIRLTNVDDETVALFREHPRLRFMTISRSPNVGDESAKTLASCPRLMQITLDGVSMGNEGVSALSTWQGIYIDWKNSPMPVVGFRKFVEGAGSHLYSVTLENAEIGDDHLEALFGCTTLRDVQISGASFKHERLVELARPPLRNLMLNDCVVDGTPLNDASLVPLAKLATPLTSIHLNGSDVTDAGVATIATSPTLHSLTLRQTKTTSKTIDSLAGLARLQVLGLGGDNFDASWMPSLAKLPSVGHLFLSGPHVDDAVFKGTSLNVQILHLDRTRVTKECLHELVKWPRLRSVVISYDEGEQPAISLDDVRAFRKETGAKIQAGWDDVMDEKAASSGGLRVTLAPPGLRP